MFKRIDVVIREILQEIFGSGSQTNAKLDKLQADMDLLKKVLLIDGPSDTDAAIKAEVARLASSEERLAAAVAANEPHE